MVDSPWHQVNIAFPDWDSAEKTSLDHIIPILRRAEDAGGLLAWFFIRKYPCWRIRIQPPPEADTATRVAKHLDALAEQGRITGWTTSVYEPEIHAFGGARAMDTAHCLFHLDSRHLTAHLSKPGDASHRRELSLMLYSLLMRSAGQDWYEQGDVWARVAEHRDPPLKPRGSSPNPLITSVTRLISVDCFNHVHPGTAMAHAADWAAAYDAAGRELAILTATGCLHRGLRDVLTHHIIFAWNRLGLPYDVQARLAAAARTAVFGPDPACVTGRTAA